MIETKNPSKLLNASSVFMIENIKIHGHRRPIKETAVASLMDSIKECGLVNPITVATKKNGDVLLVAGLHRLEACKRLGWKSIPAQTLHSSVDMLTELAEIDENLIRNELTPLEMADSLKRRKEIYERLHPPSKKGGDHTSEPGKQNAGSALSYAKDTAAKTGKSERLVQQNVKIATDLAKTTKDKIRDTPIAGNKAELEALASVPKTKQAGIVEKVLSGQAPSVRAAVEPKKLDPKKCFSPQPGSIAVSFTGLQGVWASTEVCRNAKCPSLVRRGGGMATECSLSGKVPGNTGICPLDLQFYYKKYPVTAACIQKHCERIHLQRAGLHVCTATGMRPENHPDQKCPVALPGAQEVLEQAAIDGVEPDLIMAQVPVEQGAGAVQESRLGPATPKRNPCHDFKPPTDLKVYPHVCTFVCPDGEKHLVVQELRGRICDVIGIPINQIIGDECPIERAARLKGTPADKFRKAADLLTANLDGAKIIKGHPLKIKISKLTDTERDAHADALIERTNYSDKDIEQIDELVKVNREGWTCRAELMEAAVMMLLAKAEGD